VNSYQGTGGTGRYREVELSREPSYHIKSGYGGRGARLAPRRFKLYKADLISVVREQLSVICAEWFGGLAVRLVEILVLSLWKYQ